MRSREFLNAVRNLSRSNEDMGSPEEIEEELVSVQEELDEYKGLGTVSDINEMCELTEQFVKDVKEIGTLDEINRLLELAEQYTSKGSLKEIDAVFERAATLVSVVQESKMEEAAESMAKETGVTKEIAAAMIEKYGAETAEEMLTQQQKTSVTERYRKRPAKKAQKTESMNEDGEDMNEDELPSRRRSRTSNIFARAGR